jgi:tRNA (cmo5U34)-methyltransferase
MSELEGSEWINDESVKEFIENSDRYILNRKQLFKIMKSLYNHFLLENIRNRQVKVLDLGCGDGRVTQELLKVDKNMKGTLVDGSAEMIENARKRLKNYTDLDYIQITFQELMNEGKIPPNFDFIVSSLAIHHISLNDKKSLFKYIYNHLNPGGFFLNIDVVRAPTETLEEWYLTLWKEWIMENETETGSSESFTHLPGQYKNNPDNHPDTLENQLIALESAGFKNIDCYYKYGIFPSTVGKII